MKKTTEHLAFLDSQQARREAAVAKTQRWLLAVDYSLSTTWSETRSFSVADRDAEAIDRELVEAVVGKEYSDGSVGFGYRDLEWWFDSCSEALAANQRVHDWRLDRGPSDLGIGLFHPDGTMEP